MSTNTFIRVDHSLLDTAARNIERRIGDHDKYMREASGKVRELQNAFSGDDYNAYKIQWNKVTDSDSTSKAITKASLQYAELLKYAANQYKTAQTNAVNLANSIPIW